MPRMKTDELILLRDKKLRYLVGNIDKNRKVYDISVRELSQKTQIKEPTLYEKLRIPRQFTFIEVLAIADALHFTKEQKEEIF